MRKKIKLILLCVACMMFGGCLIEQAPVNDKELGEVAQYAADLLLKYNKNYDDMLLTLDELTPTPTRETPLVVTTPTSTPEPTAGQTTGSPESPTAPPDDTPAATPTETPTPTLSPTPTEIPDNTDETWKQMARVIGEADMTVTYEGTSRPVTEGSYQVGEDILTLYDHNDGKAYIVSKFVITNNTDSTENLDCYTPGLTCVMTINGTTKMYPCEVLCMNDLRYIGVGDEAETLAPGASYEAVLIYKVDKDADIQTAMLTLTNKDKESVVIKIK